MTKLPIEAVLPSLKETLMIHTNAVLVAPPGAGKTTRIPLALLHEPWLGGRRILMLEPRRLAARSAARYMAASLGEGVGETVGYRVKLDTKVGPRTRIEVITEGILTRMLQEDPSLEDVGAVIFDEFHERSLHADLGLALCLQSQAVLREDLRILVMSATLEAEPVASLMNDAPVITSEGLSFPVETRYAARKPEGRIEPAAARCIAEALENDDGDLLVFLPGEGEIRRVEALLNETASLRSRSVRITPLYGNLAQEAQDVAIAPSKPGERKIVLATAIAESSLTVEGVRIVIDAGLARVPRFSPRTGMTRLVTVPVSRASADQRRGRAGRTAPGVCYRLWTEQDDRNLDPRSVPEIAEADLAPLALELAQWGVTDPEELLWIDPPPAAAYAQARELLRGLGALGDGGAITPHGKSMAELGLHPRLAHMLLQAASLGFGRLACELAALLNERDILRSEGAAPDADLRLRIEALRRHARERTERQQPAAYQGFRVDTAACRRILAEAAQWQRSLRLYPAGADGDGDGDIDACGILLAFAYPDRIGQRRPNGRFLLRNGRGAAFLDVQPLASTSYLVAAELDDHGAESRIYLAAPVEQHELERHLSDQLMEETAVRWDSATQSVRARKRLYLGALLLKDAQVANPDPQLALTAMLEGIAQEGLSLLTWTRAARQLQQRLCFMHRVDPAWPDASDAALLAALDQWLAPHLYGVRSRAELERLHVADMLEAWITWDQRRELDAYAPTHIVVPSGSRIPIDYSDPDAPTLAVRLQEMFGLTETPRIGRGKVPLTLHLLSPAQRPVQVTKDLASFWSNAYFEVKKDLKGRYPKHYWPDDPLVAMPTNRAKPRT
ncbi:ATP-dependent helicase HrpB [Paenibacillus sp. H1-7]|uniref:ATP-dependent helicase HrpB n=1 Tax=Paenibacillus sp. H1-7 TaxID=2282849 RepID=UPI001EF8B7BE|nr:ATP-dependent helicase HrpB [Paenibacillus sp. H1-7]ULL19732.1 ATP-dependent helicase HrpB [Paenibacillus sp. H1-7]